LTHLPVVAATNPDFLLRTGDRILRNASPGGAELSTAEVFAKAHGDDRIPSCAIEVDMSIVHQLAGPLLHGRFRVEECGAQ
jgi:hypothetical protein